MTIELLERNGELYAVVDGVETRLETVTPDDVKARLEYGDGWFKR